MHLSQRLSPHHPTTFMRLTFVLFVCSTSALASSHSIPVQSLNEHEKAYLHLYDNTEDKIALEAIRDLHRQLDEDKDGAIEPSETGDFIRGDLKYSSDKQRQKNFHGHDSEITVTDLWDSWIRSDVYNWTEDQVVDWLVNSVELPQYEENFRESHVNGTQLPSAAVSTTFLSKNLGISNPIHRSKISLKAMDVVLFGAPKDQSNFLKDMVLTTLLIIAVSGLFYAYRQNKISQDHLRRMMHDMESLTKAEETLLELQDKLQQKDSIIDTMSSTPTEVPDAVEVSRLKEELEILRSELHRAEVELEDKCWIAPPVLQHWLQLTYELESSTYNAKKKAAEEQLEFAKDMCEKLKRKRSSLVGAFVSTHGRSIDDVDRSILEAKTALMDLTKDLTERSQRWRQIETLCGCSIINNPGIAVLQNLVRHVGMGRSGVQSIKNGMSSRMSMSNSQEDLEDLDTQSIAASSTHMTVASSHFSKTSSVIPTTTSAIPSKKRGDLKALSRDMSKESASSSDEFSAEHLIQTSASANQLALIRSETPPVSLLNASTPAGIKRAKMMIKSRSHDTANPMGDTPPNISVTDAENAKPSGHKSSISSSMSSSISEGHLLQQGDKLSTKSSIPESVSSSKLKPKISQSQSKASMQEDVGDSSDTSSIHDLDEKKKKKRTLFSFGRKKEKKNVK